MITKRNRIRILFLCDSKANRGKKCQSNKVFSPYFTVKLIGELTLTGNSNVRLKEKKQSTQLIRVVNYKCFLSFHLNNCSSDISLIANGISKRREKKIPHFHTETSNNLRKTFSVC